MVGGVFSFFFFQAEDGIRDDLVTGVQTCALPIFWDRFLTKGVFEDVDSGQKAVPGSLQAAGLDHPRRRIEPKAHPRLGIEESLQTPDFQRSISQSSAGQHRDRMPTTDAQEALYLEAFTSGRFAEAPIETMTMQPP